MKFVSDLHIHSKFSRAVSPRMELNKLAEWGETKGIDLIATGDWTHPDWIKQIKQQLEETQPGVFQLKEISSGVKFILSTEISLIYSQDNQTRRVHLLVLVPSLKVAEDINKELLKLDANLQSDGRPVLGLSAKELAELVWSVDQKALIIPAHVWTPWYALYGSKSGFDSIKACFGKHAEKIAAVETGLSSDPQMNWQVEELDSMSLVSFSDAHSPSKLGRELTVLDLEEVNFNNIAQAIKTRKRFLKKGNLDFPNRILYTVEFYPEEGKYHYSGHRKCDIIYSGKDIGERGTTCPVCGKTLTLGVMYRVKQLGGKKVKIKKQQDEHGLQKIYHQKDQGRHPYVKLVPLAEILSEALDVGVKTKTVNRAYQKLIREVGSEMKILTKASYQEIKQAAGAKVAEGVKKVREGDIVVNPGYDGVFGEVTIWGEKELKNSDDQMLLFKEQ